MVNKDYCTALFTCPASALEQPAKITAPFSISTYRLFFKSPPSVWLSGAFGILWQQLIFQSWGKAHEETKSLQKGDCFPLNIATAFSRGRHSSVRFAPEFTAFLSACRWREPEASHPAAGRRCAPGRNKTQKRS